jgi:hypothetical protein
MILNICAYTVLNRVHISAVAQSDQPGDPKHWETVALVDAPLGCDVDAVDSADFANIAASLVLDALEERWRHGPQLVGGSR